MSETIDAIVKAINELSERMSALEGNHKRTGSTRNKFKLFEDKPHLPIMKAWDQHLGEVLTARELEIIYFKSQGLTNEQIAEKACIALSTVKYHITSIHRILQTRSAAELMAFIFTNLPNLEQEQT